MHSEMDRGIRRSTSTFKETKLNAQIDGYAGPDVEWYQTTRCLAGLADHIPKEKKQLIMVEICWLCS